MVRHIHLEMSDRVFENAKAFRRAVEANEKKDMSWDELWAWVVTMVEADKFSEGYYERTRDLLREAAAELRRRG